MICAVSVFCIHLQILQIFDGVHWLAIEGIDGGSIQQLAVYLVGVVLQSNNEWVGAHDGLHVLGLFDVIVMGASDGIGDVLIPTVVVESWWGLSDR